VNAFLLDTVTVSEFRKIDCIDPKVRDWQSDHVGDEMWLSVITPLEIRQGIHQVRRRDPAVADKLESWLTNTVVPEFRHRLLGVDLHTAFHAAEFRALHGLCPNDSLIAATAKVHSLTVVTRNVAHFRNIGIQLVNPWEYTAYA
jgi:predicted nucleic acid-binding protein